MSDNKNTLEKFASFVSEILTVTKEDIQKAEGEAKSVVRPEPAEAEEATACTVL